MRIAPQVVLTIDQRTKLETYARGRRMPARLVLRAKIVLLAAKGKQDIEIARLLSIVPRTAARWRARFLRDGVVGLEHDARRPGRTPSISPELVRRVITKTTKVKPPHATHWSTRTMAAAAGISEASVRRIWHSHGLKPHRVETFKLSNDSHFSEKPKDIVGLYLNPPEHALVLSAPLRARPRWPAGAGGCARRARDFAGVLARVRAGPVLRFSNKASSPISAAVQRLGLRRKKIPPRAGARQQRRPTTAAVISFPPAHEAKQRADKFASQHDSGLLDR